MNIISFYDICRPGYNGDTAVCDCDGDLSCIVTGVLSLHDMQTEPLSSGIVRLGWLGSCPLGGYKNGLCPGDELFLWRFLGIVGSLCGLVVGHCE